MDKNLQKFLDAKDYSDNYEKKVAAAADFISEYIAIKMPDKFEPKFGIVLGSGLADLADSIEGAIELPFSEIPYFPITGVEGHDGKLVIGKLEGVNVIGLKGRKHFYEVADEPFTNGILQTVFPVNVLADMGVKNYFVTNAAGGLNAKFNVGDIMVIDSHINHLPNPLLGRYHDFKRVDNGEPVERFQPMNDAYNHIFQVFLHTSAAVASMGGKPYHKGVYLATPGPSYETAPECIAFRREGADAVGMSTSNEVIAARNRGMKVAGFSCITNKIEEDGTNATNHEEVKSVLKSDRVRNRLENTVKGFFNVYALYLDK